MTKKHKAKTPRRSKSDKTVDPQQSAAPFIEHLHELRRRLLIVAVSVIVWSALAYGVEHSIVDFLIRPAHGANFIYTTVGGGIDFLFKVSLYTGILFSFPVIIYQTLRYIQPLIKRQSLRFIIFTSLASGLLAVAGILFGYYLGLPSALQFLLHQFGTERITALITVQSYLSFVIWYLFGSSLLFQVPLILFIINRIRPIKLRPLFKFERWVVLVSFIIAAMINPSPRIYDMTILALPMILSYQVGIFIVWRANHKSYRKQSKHIQTLLENDAMLRAERQSRLSNAKQTIPSDIPVMKQAPLIV